jgi:hypothetical protein
VKVGTYSPGTWSPRHGTRLLGFSGAEPELQVADHDDWDCLDDLDAAGLVQVINLANGWVRLTPAGVAMAAKIRAHKAGGGSFASLRDRWLAVA